MKKLLLFLLGCILLITLIGCSSDGAQDAVVELDADAEENEASPEIADLDLEEGVPAPRDYSLPASEVSTLKQHMKSLDKVKLSKALLKDMQADDYAIIALGVKNTVSRVGEFTVDLSFREGLNPSQQSIQLDHELLEQWIGKNVYATQTIERNEIKYLPLIVEVGDEIAPGVPLVAGTYIFDVTVNELSDDGLPHPYQAVTLTVQVVA